MGLVFYFLVLDFNNNTNRIIIISNVKDLKFNFWV